MANDLHETYGKNCDCLKCARNQDPGKPCSIWTKWGRPEHILNCWHWADRSKA